MERQLIWNKRPSEFLKSALKCISQESHANAEKVENAILTNLRKALDNPSNFHRIGSKHTILVFFGHLKHMVFELPSSSIQKK